jgi:large subunit ribosomal protein L6
MSRLGKKPVPIVAGVKITVTDHLVRIQGPKGTLEQKVPPGIQVNVDEAARQIVVTRGDDEKQTKALHGLTRAMLANHVLGVTEGYKRSLEIQGVGYKAELEAGKLSLIVGYANTVVLAVPAGLEVRVEGQRIHVSGTDKQMVGEFAARVRRVRKPEPYKGKGIRYEGEIVKIKPGKAVTATGATK